MVIAAGTFGGDVAPGIIDTGEVIPPCRVPGGEVMPGMRGVVEEGGATVFGGETMEVLRGDGPEPPPGEGKIEE